MNRTPAWIVKLYFFFYAYYQILHQFIIPVLKKKNDQKVFCIGFWKTGTTSIYKAFTLLGYRSGRLINVGKEPKIGWIPYIKKSNYDAFTDDPMSFIYKDLDKNFPNSKFILTERDKKSFSNSYINYFKGTEFEKSSDEVEEVLDYALKVAEAFDLTHAALDLLRDEAGKLQLVENTTIWERFQQSRRFPSQAPFFERTDWGWEPSEYTGGDFFELLAKMLLEGCFRWDSNPAHEVSARS